MVKLLKNLSVRHLIESAGNVRRRFPLSNLFLLMLTLWALIQAWDAIPGDVITTHRSDILSYYLASGLLLSLVLEVWTQEFTSKTRMWTVKASAHLLFAANALIMAFCFDEVDTEMVYGIASVIAALSVGFPVLPFHREKDDMASWNFGVRTAWWAVWSFFVSGMLLAGLVLLLNAIRELFGVGIPDRVFTTLCVLFLIGLPLWIWMGKIPSGKGKFIREPFSSAFMVKSARYLLVPLLTLYLAVLYAYALKSLFIWTLPDGWVSWFVTALMGGYLVMSLIFYVTKKESLNRTDLWLVRNMPYLILPLVVMMSIGIVRRFMDYGVTANRLYMLTLNLWFYYVLFRMCRQKSPRISWVGVSLTCLMVLVSAFPVNYHSATRHYLSSHVRKVLSQQLGLTLPVGLDEFKDAIRSLPEKEAKKLTDQCAYLSGDRHGKALKGIVTYNTSNPFIYISKGMASEAGESMWYHWDADPSVLGIPEGFTSYVETDESWKVGDDFITARIQDKVYIIPRWQFDALLDRIASYMEDGEKPLIQDEVTLWCGDGSLLLCRSVSFNEGSPTAHIKAHLFLK